MYTRQIIEAGGNFHEEHGCPPEIPTEEPTDIYLMGVGDGEAFANPTLPESDEYWDGYETGLRTYHLKLQDKTVEYEL